MATRSSFEEKNRERRRRERIRKKRIRTAISLIAVAGVIALVCVTISVVNKNKREAQNYASQPETTSQAGAPSDGQSISTVTASIDGTVTGTSTLGADTAQGTQPSDPAAQNGQTQQNGMSIPSAAEENDLLEIIENSGQTKRCYLTFDDGPTTNITPQILDTLRRYNVKATFFQVGSLIQANPDMARRVYEEGHLIANHSQGHEYAELYESTETFMTEVNSCYEAIKSVTDGEEPFKLVRFPGGSYNSSADSYAPVKQECKTALKEAGFYYCDWNSLNGDAEGRTKDADELLAYLQENAAGQNNLVVLMHDAAAKQATADYLGSAIEWLISEGYTFHRLDDIDYNPAGTASASPDGTAAGTDGETAQVQ